MLVVVHYTCTLGRDIRHTGETGKNICALGSCLFTTTTTKGQHCALNGVLCGHFPGNQDGAVNLKSQLIFIKF